MYSTLIIDFSRVLIFSHDDVDSLNKHHEKLAETVKHYSALDHFYLNTVLLAYLGSLPSTVKVYLFSDGKLHGLPDINSQISRIFTKIITAEEIGYKKDNPKAYIALTNILAINPSTILFVDDKAANIQAASIAGIKAIKFMNNSQIIAALNDQIKTP